MDDHLQENEIIDERYVGACDEMEKKFMNSDDNRINVAAFLENILIDDPLIAMKD